MADLRVIQFKHRWVDGNEHCPGTPGKYLVKYRTKAGSKEVTIARAIFKGRGKPWVVPYFEGKVRMQLVLKANFQWCAINTVVDMREAMRYSGDLNQPGD